ncbi:DUF3575 domain-containing protein [Spirosoma foliorum]|uniref:DUF3575 domain-containing protein n=1 Tax=Spirosoma foliorum TaxID=2710596 RepID=A0A7G5H183_9BACT|nr:DUF3575 domain-containing protein [Spirosoma foliorum]QMW04875.1 DUF3575 domain-containing protein [Spirosoma foliorum]
MPTRLRLVVYSLLLSAATSNSLSAQDSTRRWSRPNLVKTNLFAPVSLFYERALSERFALQGSVRWLSYYERHNVNFVNVALEARFYLNDSYWLQHKDHPAGLYLSPYLKARSLTYINEIGYGFNKVGDLDEVIIKSIGFGGTIGYQWVSRNGFTVDAFLGIGAMPAGLSSYEHTMRYSTVISTNGFTFHSLDSRAGISLGYSF